MKLKSNILKLALFSFILLLLNTGVVKAAYTTQGAIEINTGIYSSGGGVSAMWHAYHLYDTVHGQIVPAYCRNPGLSNGQSALYQNYNVIQHLTVDTKDKDLRAYNSGIIAIMGNSKYKYGSSYVYYVATNQALRIFEGLSKFNTNNVRTYYSDDNRMYSLRGQINNYISKYKSLIQQAFGTIYYPRYQAMSETFSSSGGTINAEIDRLIQKGLDAAIKSRNTNLTSVTVSPAVTKVKPVVTRDDEVKEYEREITHTITVKNFDFDGAYLRPKFICTDCAKYNIQYELFFQDQSYGQEFPSDFNLLDYIEDDKNGSADIKIVLKTTSETYYCDKVNYRIAYEYSDIATNQSLVPSDKDCFKPSVDTVKSSTCSYCQKFYTGVVEKVDVNGTEEYPCGDPNNDGTGSGVSAQGYKDFNFQFCKPDCPDLREKCEDDTNSGNPDSDNCKKLEELCDDTVGCTAYVDNVECSANDSDIYLKEGYYIDGTTCKVPESANVLKCVINGKDVSDNSYQDADLINNSYCKVFCKEDYHFTFPGNQNTVSGRYFTLQTSIHGAKTCYSDINRKKFDADYEAERQKLMDAYNNWAAYASAMAQQGHNLIGQRPGAVHTGHPWCCTPLTGCTCWCSDQNPSYMSYMYTWSFNAYDIAVANTGVSIKGTGSLDITSQPNVVCNVTSKGIVTCTYTSLGSPGTCSGHSCNRDQYDGTDLNFSNYSAKMSHYAGLITQAAQQLDGLRNLFNSCDDWTMDYKYDPEIYFDYEESYMNDIYTNKLDTVGSVDKKEVKKEYCNYYGMANLATGTSNYGEVVNDAYETCNTGWQSNASEEGLSKMICTTSDGYNGCSPKTVNIMRTSRMKETIEVDAKYTTPTQFYNLYPTGSVVVSENKDADIDNSDRQDERWMVGLGTTQGVWSWGLVVEKLGEYYNNHNLGRIWGDPDGVVDVVTSTENVCLEEGGLKSETQIGDNYYDEGVYVCAYKVNCPECPVECDETGCYNPDCPDNSCPVVCDNCLFTNGKSNLNYRPVTTEDLNPNDRNLGVNWNYQSSTNGNGGSTSEHTNTTSGQFNITTALELKAYATTREIEEAGEKIYEVTVEDSQVTAPNTDYAVEVILDAQTKNFIRIYNDAQEANGGFADNSLECYDYKDKDGNVYKNIFCYSKFLDEFTSELPNKIHFSKTRPTKEQRSTQSNGYWTTWSEFTTEGKDWNITTSTGLVYNTNFGNNGVGPSWK